MRKTTAYARKRARQCAFDKNRHEVINPVTEAVIRSRIEADIQRLRTDTGLQAYIGEDAARVANMAGRLVYIVCHAAGVHGLSETPEARILAGTANALGDIAETPAELERQRDVSFAWRFLFLTEWVGVAFAGIFGVGIFGALIFAIGHEFGFRAR